MPDVRLKGCRSRPLVGYLKALGVLRLVAAQADADTRGRWSGSTFELRSNLDAEGLTRFFLERYAPTPVVSPWNGGSGFFPKDNKEGFEAILESADPRFEPFTVVITAARAVLERQDLHEKPSSEAAKLSLIRELRRILPDVALAWLDASIVLTGSRAGFPPVLGSGGNDGRFDFSNNFARALVKALLTSDSTHPERWLQGALHDAPAELEPKMSLGHFLRDSSPVNSPFGEADSLGNPWDLILGIEGTLLLAAGASRRHGSHVEPNLAAPFTARPTAAGYGSAVSGEAGRAELWQPLWDGWASLREIENLVREGRAQVGRRSARTGLDFARAAGELGVARGIRSFERYAILERAGQSSLAVPAGRISVEPRPAAGALRSIDPWLQRVLRHSANERCPSGLTHAIHALERAAFSLAEHGRPADAGAVLEALGSLETALAVSATYSTEAGLRPLYGPARPWLESAHDGSPEFAVAAALASLRDRRPETPALRDYLHGTTVENGRRAFDPEGRVRIAGRADPVTRLAAIHARRHIDAAHRDVSARNGEEFSIGKGLAFDHGLGSPPEAARLFAWGLLDDARIMRLLAGLTLLDFGKVTKASSPASFGQAPPTPAFELLALACAGTPDVRMYPRPGWVARLAAGAVGPVLDEAVLRLRLAQLTPIPSATDLRSAAGDGPRLAAALMLRIGPQSRVAIARRMTLPRDPESTNIPTSNPTPIYEEETA